jgi:hypothetical protein
MIPSPRLPRADEAFDVAGITPRTWNQLCDLVEQCWRITASPGITVASNANGKIIGSTTTYPWVERWKVTTLPTASAYTSSSVILAKRWDGVNQTGVEFPIRSWQTHEVGDEFLAVYPDGGVTFTDGSATIYDSNPVYWEEISEDNNVIASINDEPETADVAGLYQYTVIDTGQATGFPTMGMTVPADTDSEYCNLAEADFINGAGADYQFSHWLQPGSVVSGFLCGTSSVTGLPLIAGSMPNPYAEFEVTVTKDGGTSGTVLFTYTVKDLNTKILGTAQTPVWGQFLSANPATHGMAFYDGSGNFKLATVDTAPPGLRFEVTLTMSGGSNGSVSGATVTNATYTYNAYDLSGNELTADAGGPRTPTWNRPQGILTGPASHGVGYFTVGGIFVLSTTDEQGVVVGCAS